MSLSTLCSGDDILAGFSAVHKHAFGMLEQPFVGFVMRDKKIRPIGLHHIALTESAFKTWCDMVTSPKEKEYSIYTNVLDESGKTWSCTLSIRNQNNRAIVFGTGNSPVEALNDCSYICELVKNKVINSQLFDCI